MSTNPAPIRGAIAPAGVSSSATSVQGRKRPLRTYGRRSNAIAEQTSPRSRVEQQAALRPELQRIEEPIPSPELEVTIDEDTIVVVIDNFSEESSSLPSPSLPPPAASSQQPKRSSILSYFKPVAASVPAAVQSKSDDIEEEEEEPSLTTATTTSVPRKRRRLTTRPEGLFSSKRYIGEQPSSGDDFHEASAEEKQDATTTTATTATKDGSGRNPKKTQDISPKGAHGAPFISVSSAVAPNTLLHQRHVLRDAAVNLLNQIDDHNDRDQPVPSSPAASSSSSSPAEEIEKKENRCLQTTTTQYKKKKIQKKKELVQTTLNVAINPGPGFTICKDCGILYNPLNEMDRKEHKRRHAAHLRSAGSSTKAKVKGS